MLKNFLYLNQNKNCIIEQPISFSGEAPAESGEGTIKLEVSLIYNDSFSDQIYAYANSIHNVEGGTHLSGFRTALTRVINNYARQNDMMKEKDLSLTGDDVREGLTAIISVKVPEPRFEGQTKTKLSNREVDGIVQKIVGEKMTNLSSGLCVLLTPLEREILVVFFKNKKIQRDYFLEQILKLKKNIETKTVESHLTRIRKKLLKIESDIQITAKEDVFYLHNHYK